MKNNQKVIVRMCALLSFGLFSSCIQYESDTLRPYTKETAINKAALQKCERYKLNILPNGDVSFSLYGNSYVGRLSEVCNDTKLLKLIKEPQ